MLHRPPLALLLALLLLLTACARASQQPETASDVQVSLQAAPDPAMVGPTTLHITLADAAGQPIDGANIQIKGDMTHAGMQPVLAQTTNGQKGQYEVPFEWTMAGDWIVSLDIALPDGRTLTRRFDLTVGGAMDMGWRRRRHRWTWVQRRSAVDGHGCRDAVPRWT